MFMIDANSWRVTEMRCSSVSSSQYAVPYSEDHSGLQPYLVGSIGLDQSISVIALRESRAADASKRADTSSVPWSRRLMTFSDRSIAAVMENSLPVVVDRDNDRCNDNACCQDSTAW